MRISVAMCTHNASRFLREQLDSIACQTRPLEELVICDDGSQDNTAEIVKNFSLNSPFPVRFIQNGENLGTARNFEKSISMCKGELIALCDQDDVWFPEKLEKLAAILERDHTLGGAFSDAELIDEQSQPLGRRLWAGVHYAGLNSAHCHVEGPLARTLLKYEVVTGATLMIRAVFREKVLPIPLPWIHDGWIAWMLVLHSGIAATPDPLVKYRIHRDQQIGIGSNRVLERVRQAREVGRKQHALIVARRFEAIRAHWIQNPPSRCSISLDDIDAKIQLSYLRVNLSPNYLMRIPEVGRAAHLYLRYSRGIPIMCRDLLV